MTFNEIALTIAKNLLSDDIPETDLKTIIDKAINFDAPLVHLHDNIFTLELFHGPTLSFKDFGGRFLAQLIAHFNRDSQITILVATSGDTGSGIASGFAGIPNTKVILLYPSGKVSKIQEQQLTTMNGNTTALEIEGSFDDCHNLTRTAFADPDLNQLHLTSANSINIARLIPQSFYYFYAYSQLADKKIPPVFSVPSGNFGNLTGGILAKRMGLPITKFVAANNANDAFTRYIKTGQYDPKPTVSTISNAMDVGNPSNFLRIQDLYGTDPEKMRQDIWSQSYNDELTRETIRKVYKNTGYILDPHGAVAYLGLRDYLGTDHSTPGIFLETAHPAKFLDVVEPLIEEKIEIPQRLAECMSKTKKATKLPAEYQKIKEFLLQNN